MIETVHNPMRGAGPPKTAGEVAQATRPVVTTPGPAQDDVVDLSAAAQRNIGANEDAPIRHELVEQVKAEIADGTYLTDAKLDAAIDRMIKRIMA